MKTAPGIFCLIFGSIILVSCGGSSDSGLSADAGDDLTIDEGGTVSLNGSYDEETGSVVVNWTQIVGPPVEFSATDILNPEVEFPRTSENLDVVLRLTVSDNSSDDSDDIRIRVINLQNGPAGPSPQGIDDGGRDDRRGAPPEGPRDLGTRPVRTYDGSGNNLDNEEWGTAFSHLQRIANADYEDGISSLAGDSTRPSARAISNMVMNQEEGQSLPNSFGHTDMVWQWGQFIDHDLDLTDGAEEAANITVPLGDPQFDPDSTGTVEIPFSRALYDPDTGTSLASPREQENEITSWLDGSMIYGSDDGRALALRVGEDSAFLATSENNLLPFNPDTLANAVGFVQDPTTLFLAGDVRVNEQIGLSVMHTLWVREHNRIAQNLIDDGVSDDPEALFQHARRLVVAKLQKITYDEFLPALLGPSALPAYAGYQDDINPTIYNEFSVAAYRFGHSLVNQQLWRLDAEGNETADGHLSLREAFFTAIDVLIEEDSIDPILRGLATQPHQAVDAFVIQDIRNFLFGAPGDGGLDLPSLNIQRGRDHGVPSFNDMREAMGLDRYTLFSEITDDTELQTKLSEAYGGAIDEIDLWVGGLSEDAVGQSQFGELFHEIISKQFQELRGGDRFWYQIDLAGPELNAIENVTFAQVIRDNTSIGDELQDDVFSVP